MLQLTEGWDWIGMWDNTCKALKLNIGIRIAYKTS